MKREPDEKVNGNAAPGPRAGEVTANEPGTHEVIALRLSTETQDRIVHRLSVTVTQAAVGNVGFNEPPTQVYGGIAFWKIKETTASTR
jgi:hypothetical protein